MAKTDSNRMERAAHVAVIVLAVIATGMALSFAAEIFAPTALALVVGMILSPLSSRLDALGLPRLATSLASFFVAVILAASVVAAAQPIISRAVETLPTVYVEMRSAVYTIQSELRGIEAVEEEVRAMVDPGNSGKGDQAGTGDSIPTVQDVVFMAPAILAQVVVFLGVLFFFILTRQEIYGFLAARLVAQERHEETALRLAAAERQVSVYFTTISVINLALGLTVAAVMWAIGLPSPILWGMAAFLLNYVLYAGPALLAVAFGVAGITVFDGATVLLPPLAFLALNFFEAQFVTPAFLGRRLSVNPLAIFLSLALFLWLWGPVGAIVSIPLLVWGIVLTADIRQIRSYGPEKNPVAAVDREPPRRAAG